MSDNTAGDGLIGPLDDSALRVFDGVKGRWMTDIEARHYLRNLPYEFYVLTPAVTLQDDKAV